MSSTATTASPTRSPARRPSRLGPARRRPYDDVKAKSGLSIALTPWTGVAGRCSAAIGRTPASPRSTSTTTATSTWCWPSDGALADRASSTIASASSTRRRSTGHRPTRRSPGLLVTDFDADGRADLVAPMRGGPVLAWRNVDRADHRRGDQDHLRVMADQRDAMAIGPGHRPRPRRPARPARTPRRVGASRASSSLPAWARNEGKRFAATTLPLGLESPGRRRSAGGRPGRRCIARHPGDPPRRASRAGAEPGQRPALAGPPARRPLARSSPS